METAEYRINRGTKVLKNIRIIKHSRISERIKFLSAKNLYKIRGYIKKHFDPRNFPPLPNDPPRKEKSLNSSIHFHHFDNNDFVIN